MSKVCGNERCCTSTDIAGNFTHGWGELDYNGFWEFECPKVKEHAADDAVCFREMADAAEQRAVEFRQRAQALEEPGGN